MNKGDLVEKIAKKTDFPKTAITEVLNEAILAGGSSLRDHAQTNGDIGYFQHNFMVYGREGQACKKNGCGNKVKRIIQSGRSTFYCAKCQS